jgi:hypothetical protein
MTPDDIADGMRVTVTTDRHIAGQSWRGVTGTVWDAQALKGHGHDDYVIVEVPDEGLVLMGLRPERDRGRVMARLSEAEKARRAAALEAARRAEHEAWVRAQVAKAPPLTERQVLAVSAVLAHGRETSQPAG